MNKQANDLDENEDWLATCAIYTDAKNISVTKLPSGSLCGCLEIPISVASVAFVRQVSSDDDNQSKRFRLWTLSSEEAPILSVKFFYDQQRDSPTSITISFARYPESWPANQEPAYVDWLTNQALAVLKESEQSYAVCEFLVHDGLRFFLVDHQDEKLGYSLVVLPYILENSECNVSYGEFIDPISAVPQYYKKKQKSVVCPSTLEAYGKETLLKRWKLYFRIKCPICFDTFSLGNGVTITCGHSFCPDCIETYLRYKVTELPQYNDNPFLCPLLSCKRRIPIMGCVKKFLSKDDMDKVNQWYKDLKQPLCWSLDRCLSRKCNQQGTMRYLSTQQITPCVYCEACGGTWCERCLGRIKDEDHTKSCDPTLAIQFCQRYLAASDAIKEKCEARYPWIKIYANSQGYDVAAMAWINEHGQRCPACSTGVERIEGCFHMTCSCGTHFCYECGDQIFPPYYGTHHCWEQTDFADDEWQ